jgi:uncharacterized protein
VCVKIDLSQIDDEPLRFDERLSLEPERLDQDQVTAPVEVHLVGTIRSAGPGFSVDGTFEATGPLVCVRCLEPVEWQVCEHYSLEYRRREAHPDELEVALEDGELDVGFLTDEVLDLSEVAVEQVLLALPMRMVCDEKCAGLCPRCGANRNLEGACRCEPDVDPRWAALKDIVGGQTAN